MVQDQRLRVVAEFRGECAQLPSGRRRAADLQVEPRLVRPLSLRPRKRSCKGRRGIEIETLRLQGGFEARSARLLMRDGQPPHHGAAIDLCIQFFDSDAIGADADITAQPQRLLAAIGDFAAALQPRHQRIRIGRIHLKRAGEAAGRLRLHPAATEDDVGRARRSKIQSADCPRPRIAVQIGLQILQRPPAQHDLLGTERDLRRYRCDRRCGHPCAQRR